MSPMGGGESISDFVLMTICILIADLVWTQHGLKLVIDICSSYSVITSFIKLLKMAARGLIWLTLYSVSTNSKLAPLKR